MKFLVHYFKNIQSPRISAGAFSRTKGKLWINSHSSFFHFDEFRCSPIQGEKEVEKSEECCSCQHHERQPIVGHPSRECIGQSRCWQGPNQHIPDDIGNEGFHPFDLISWEYSHCGCQHEDNYLGKQHKWLTSRSKSPCLGPKQDPHTRKNCDYHPNTGR